MKNKTNTIPIKGTVVETIIIEFRDKFNTKTTVFGGYLFEDIEAFLSSALLRVQDETIKEVTNEIKGNITLETSQALARISDKFKEKK